MTLNDFTYDQIFAALAEKTKKDAGLAQPHKNYCLSDLERLHALYDRAGRITNAKPPAGMLEGSQNDQAAKLNEPVMSESGQSCPCTEAGGKPQAHCPIHGLRM